MKHYKLSVIACIYRVEPYIEKACRSLFDQTLDDIEFIFVDDASPDRSVEKLQNIVVKEYPHLANNIKLVRNKNNLGVSESRQTATDMASGDFIIHFDTDDWINPDAYREMYEKAVATTCDIVVCDVVEEWGNGNTFLTKHQSHQPPGRFKYEIISEKIPSYLVNKMIRRSIISDNNIRFMKQIGFMEDYAFMSEISLVVNKVEFISKPFYHYRKTNKNSLTKGFSDKQFDSMLKIIPYLEEKIKPFDEDKELTAALYSAALRFKLSILLNQPSRERKNFSRLFPEADRYIFRKQIFGSYYKAALWFNSIGWTAGFNMIVGVVNRVKKFSR